MTTVPNLTLNDGNAIPQLGFGVFQIPPEDTAAGGPARARRRLPPHRHRPDLPNERASATASPAPASTARDVYITSKLNNGFHEPDDARRAFETTLEELGIDHLDLFLIHWPLPTLYDGDYVSTWKDAEEFMAAAAPARSASRTSSRRTSSGSSPRPTSSPP